MSVPRTNLKAPWSSTMARLRLSAEKKTAPTLRVGEADEEKFKCDRSN